MLNTDWTLSMNHRTCKKSRRVVFSIEIFKNVIFFTVYWINQFQWSLCCSLDVFQVLSKTSVWRSDSSFKVTIPCSWVLSVTFIFFPLSSQLNLSIFHARLAFLLVPGPHDKNWNLHMLVFLFKEISACFRILNYLQIKALISLSLTCSCKWCSKRSVMWA